MLCHDAMVQERNIDPAECMPQFVGNGLIIGAGKWVAPRVVMGNYQGASIAIKTFFNDFSRVNGRLINRSPKELLALDETIAVV